MCTPAPTSPSPYAGMGAVLQASGCSYRVWAPNADGVLLGGDFLHIGTFNRNEANQIGTFDDATARLTYIRDLGCNAIQIMPAFDFDTTTSMGYNPGLPFAIDNAYGRLGAMKSFVLAAHQLGLAVILDVVYNHFGPQGLDDCLSVFDGTTLPGRRGIYFYQDDRIWTRPHTTGSGRWLLRS